jgi:hypothetical protein
LVVDPTVRMGRHIAVARTQELLVACARGYNRCPLIIGTVPCKIRSPSVTLLEYSPHLFTQGTVSTQPAMWLLDSSTLQLEEFFGARTPPYAILSHTWAKEEVSYDEMQEARETLRHKAGFKKIKHFCELAKRYGFSYAWVDSCCIDKRSSAELSEAINSMYTWYRDAGICMVYLVDVPGRTEQTIGQPSTQIEAFKKSRWFTRGWTLQELIASSRRQFFASDWSMIDDIVPSGHVGHDFVDLISDITHISEVILRDRDKLQSFCVAERISWAAHRQTTRPEDAAYSLMGLFNVNMPILYGEGVRSAFRRLQDEIIKTSFDQTIFAWRGPYESSGLLAQTPANFADTPQLEIWPPTMLAPFSMTNAGLSIRLPVFQGSIKNPPGIVFAALQCDINTNTGWKILLIRLRRVENANCVVNGKQCKAYRRVNCTTWDVVPTASLLGCPYEDLLVLQDEHFELIKSAVKSNTKRWSKRVA